MVVGILEVLQVDALLLTRPHERAIFPNDTFAWSKARNLLIKVLLIGQNRTYVLETKIRHGFLDLLL